MTKDFDLGAKPDEASGELPNQFIEDAIYNIQNGYNSEAQVMAEIATAQALTRIADVMEDLLIVHAEMLKLQQRAGSTPATLAVPPHIAEALSKFRNGIE